ncbi:dephospho-CoA kinase [Coprothermobacter platensis]|jgi:dephospho-CoA kinase|uniref:dephospho-CoA kinase n=1 Tax=Coprothermobacter platensis TaxID=108819 RepID=UPI00036C3015|nr:dephospho-CoA kinase [Coprothermobacter platensis]
MDSGITLGLAGWIGVGKSTIASYFEEQLAAETFRLDDISHDLYKNDELCAQLRKTFGTSERKEIGFILQSQPSLWDSLDGIFKPFLVEETRRLWSLSPSSFRIIEGSLLLKLDLQDLCDVVVWVTMHPLEEALKRSSVRMNKPYAYCLGIMDRQIKSGLFDPKKIDILEVEDQERDSLSVYEDIRRHLRL